MLSKMRRILLFLGVFFYVSQAIAVQDSLETEKRKAFEFIADSLNEMIFLGNNPDFRCKFYDKIDSFRATGKGRINILHIGGSHVQADIFSHTVRCRIDSLNGEFKPSRGVLFPYQVAKTNNPSNYKVTYAGEWKSSRNIKRDREAILGVTGMAVSTVDSIAEIRIKLNPKDSVDRWSFSRLKLLGYAEHPKVIPLLKLGNSSFLHPIYDSVTSTYTYLLSVPMDSLNLIISQTDTILHRFTLTGFLLENDEPGIVYHSIGVNGASVPSYLSCPNFERDLSLIRPDMVIFAIGINDAIPQNFSKNNFIANYDSLLSKFRNVSPDCFFVFVSNNDSYRKIKRRYRRTRYQLNTNGVLAREAFVMLAEKHDGSLWDLFSIMGGLDSIKKWEESGLSQKDKVHFTKAGYTLVGNLFFEAFLNSYNNKD